MMMKNVDGVGDNEARKIISEKKIGSLVLQLEKADYLRLSDIVFLEHLLNHSNYFLFGCCWICRHILWRTGPEKNQ